MTTRDQTTQAPSRRTGKGLRHAWLAAVGLALAATGGVSSVLAQEPTASGPAAAVTVTDDTGTSVTIPAVPRRVVSLTPATTEIAFALGAGDRLVGGTDADDAPAQAAALPDVVSQTKVLMEQLVALQPDLVLAGANGFTPDDDITHIRALGIPVVATYSDSVDDVLVDIRTIGTALGGDATAESVTLTGRMGSELHAIGDIAAAAGTTPRTFYEIGDGPDLYGPAPGSFIADMIERAGGDPITTSDPAVFAIPVEQLVTDDPQVILLGDAAYGTCPDAVAARPGWSVISAVREGAIRPVDDAVITRPGPRLADGLASLTRAIHPELAQQLADHPADPPMCGIGASATPAPGAASAASAAP